MFKKNVKKKLFLKNIFIILNAKYYIYIYFFIKNKSLTLKKTQQTLKKYLY